VSIVTAADTTGRPPCSSRAARIRQSRPACREDGACVVVYMSGAARPRTGLATRRSISIDETPPAVRSRDHPVQSARRPSVLHFTDVFFARPQAMVSDKRPSQQRGSVSTSSERIVVANSWTSSVTKVRRSSTSANSRGVYTV